MKGMGKGIIRERIKRIFGLIIKLLPLIVYNGIIQWEFEWEYNRIYTEGMVYY